MSFNPLGHFDPKAPVNNIVVSEVKKLYNLLPTVPKGGINRIYGHWTVAGLTCDFTDYNVEVKLDGKFLYKIEHDPCDDVAGLNNNAPISGTWHRNTGSVAIAITGMDGASEHDFGPHGVTVLGLTYLAAGVAAMALRYDIDLNGKVAAPGSNHADNNGNNVNTTGEHTFLTHAECAVLDAYPTERWDLGSFIPLPAGVILTNEMRSLCGDAIRQMAHTYKVALIALQGK